MGWLSSKKPKQPITKYYASIHFGICQGPVDAVRGIWVGEKQAWDGVIRDSKTLGISKEGFFGGIKKEGGLLGDIDIMMGQTNGYMSPALASKLGFNTVTEGPGFRGVLTLLFRGKNYGYTNVFAQAYAENGDGFFGLLAHIASFFQNGFYWGASNPYIKPVWVTVQRAPKGLHEATASIPRGSSKPASIYFALDDSGSMAGDRMATLQASMLGVMDAVQGQLESGWDLDLGMSAFNGGSIERTAVDLADLADFRSWINSMSAFGGTDFDAAIQPMVSWFTASAGDSSIKRRIGVFVTDGEPYPLESADDAAATAAALLNRSIPVDMYGVNIDLEETEHTAKLDNTSGDGVPVVDGGSASGLVNTVMAAVWGALDANPAHIIYECLTDTDWGMGLPSEAIDGDSFLAAGDTLVNERFGLFLQWHAPSPVEDFINIVLDHIRGVVYPHPGTGKITLRLVRDDLDVPNLRVIDPGNATLANFSRKAWGETTNEVIITWTNPATEKEETVRAQDLANIAMQGGVVSDGKNYHGIRTPELAQRVADRELRSASAPLASCEVTVDRAFWDIVPYEGVKVTWPEYGLDELVMRVVKVDYGDSKSARIRLSLLEDVFTLPLASYVEPQSGLWINPAAPPLPVDTARLMPLTAYAVAYHGEVLADGVYPETLVSVLAKDPTEAGGAQFDMLEEAVTPDGTTVWVDIADTQDFIGTATLDAELTPEVTSTGVTMSNIAGMPLFPGALLLIGPEAAAEVDLELALVTAGDDLTNEVTLLRGALDTVPKTWPAGTLVWITTFDHWAPIPVDVVDGDAPRLKLLTVTKDGQLAVASAPVFEETALARPTKPLRPADLKIDGNDIATPYDLEADTVTLSWAHRNRLTESTGAFLAWDAASITPEAGTTYRVEIDGYEPDGTPVQAGWYSQNVGLVTSHTIDFTVDVPPAGSGRQVFRIFAVRGGEDSWQAAEIAATIFHAPYNFTGVFIPD